MAPPGSETSEGLQLVDPRKDVDRLKDLLIREYGYKEEDIVILTDRPDSPEELQHMRELECFPKKSNEGQMEDTGPGDSPFYYDAEHTFQSEGSHNTESRDEAPSDSDYPEGVINDDVDINPTGDSAQRVREPPVAKAQFFPDSHDFCINGGTFCEVGGNSVTSSYSNNPIGTVNALTFDFGANEVANEKNIAALLIGSNLGFGVASYFGIDATVSPLQRTALSLSVYASIHTLHSVTVSFSLWVFILLVFKRSGDCDGTDERIQQEPLSLFPTRESPSYHQRLA